MILEMASKTPVNSWVDGWMDGWMDEGMDNFIFVG